MIWYHGPFGKWNYRRKQSCKASDATVRQILTSITNHGSKKASEQVQVSLPSGYFTSPVYICHVFTVMGVRSQPPKYHCCKIWLWLSVCTTSISSISSRTIFFNKPQAAKNVSYATYWWCYDLLFEIYHCTCYSSWIKPFRSYIDQLHKSKNRTKWWHWKHYFLKIILEFIIIYAISFQ